jgi:hypothetical protein
LGLALRLQKRGSMTTTKYLQGELLDVLEDVLDFLDNQFDVVDGDYGEPRPNKAMSLHNSLAPLVRRLERDMKAQQAARPRTEEEKLQSILRVLRGKMNSSFDTADVDTAVDSGWLRGVARGVLYALEERI